MLNSFDRWVAMASEGGAADGVCGEVIQAGGKRPPKLVESSSGKRWSQNAQATFLETLAASANVTRSADAAGFSPTAIYGRRRKYPAFAAQWEEALAVGYMRLEALLIENATDTLGGAELKADRPVPPMTVSEAMHLLALHRKSVKTGARRSDWRARVPDPDAARAEILRKVAALRRALTGDA